MIPRVCRRDNRATHRLLGRRTGVGRARRSTKRRKPVRRDSGRLSIRALFPSIRCSVQVKVREHQVSRLVGCRATLDSDGAVAPLRDDVCSLVPALVPACKVPSYPCDIKHSTYAEAATTIRTVHDVLRVTLVFNHVCVRLTVRSDPRMTARPPLAKNSAFLLHPSYSQRSGSFTLMPAILSKVIREGHAHHEPERRKAEHHG